MLQITINVTTSLTTIVASNNHDYATTFITFAVIVLHISCLILTQVVIARILAAF